MRSRKVWNEARILWHPTQGGISPSLVLELLDARCTRTQDSLGTVSNVQLIKDGGDMVLHRFDAQREVLSDLVVAAA